MMDGVMSTGKHLVGHGNTGVRMRRVCVLIGNHQLIGAAQIHRVNDPNGNHLFSGSHHSHGSDE